MPGIPNQPVFGKVVTHVQGKAQFHHSQVAGKVGRPNSKHTHQLIAHFLRELLQVSIVQPV
jgi:hypothetical protein